MSWSRSLSEFADEQEKRLNAELRATALQALTGVVERSPVDTGRFRGNNQVTVGEETDQPLDGAIRGERETLADGRRIIEGIKKPFTYIVVQNALPYAGVLEAGSSEQTNFQPGGIYAVTFNNLKERRR